VINFLPFKAELYIESRLQREFGYKLEAKAVSLVITDHMIHLRSTSALK